MTVLESDEWLSRVTEVVDEAHRENFGGEHCNGFCKACAAALLVAQIAVPRSEQPSIYDERRARAGEYSSDEQALETECHNYGLYPALRLLLRHIYGNAAATFGAQESLIKSLTERLEKLNSEETLLESRQDSEHLILNNIISNDHAYISFDASKKIDSTDSSIDFCFVDRDSDGNVIGLEAVGQLAININRSIATSFRETFGSIPPLLREVMMSDAEESNLR
jgi:uncharacterized protein YuzE